MLPHKELNDFIKKYNNVLSLRGYSKMNVTQKNNLVQAKVRALGNNTLASEFNKLKSDHADKMKKMDESTKAKRRRSARVSNRGAAANLVGLSGRNKKK